MIIKLKGNEHLSYNKNGTTLNLDEIPLGEPIIVPWEQLRSMREMSELISGQYYRIYNYNCRVNSELTDFHADNHNRFDIVVKALSNNTLSEDAYLLPPIDQNYNLSSWMLSAGAFYKYISKIKIKYCIDNDITRFNWANYETGTGVIYRMIDEYGNDMPFDFIHIMFKRYTIHREENYPLYGAPFFPEFHNYIKAALPNSSQMIPSLSNNVKSEIYTITYSDIDNTLSSSIVEDYDYVYVISALSRTLSDPTPMNLLLPVNPSHLRQNDTYQTNQHPVNNVIKARYSIVEIDGNNCEIMNIPNITIVSDDDNNYIRMNNNYFGSNADNISVYGSCIENNKFNGTINNVFFGGYQTENLNIRKDANILNAMFMSLIDTNIGGYINNSLFLYPIHRSSINGQIINSLIYHVDHDQTYPLANINIEKSTVITGSLLILAICQSDTQFLSLRDLNIYDSVIRYTQGISNFSIRTLSGDITHSLYYLDVSKLQDILNDGIPKYIYSRDELDSSKNTLEVYRGRMTLLGEIDPATTW